MIDVQIVAYGAGHSLLACIESVRAPDVRIVVVDHLGDARADLLVGDVILLLDVSNPGFGAGHNRALASGSAPWVLLMNPDARMHTSAMDVGADYLRTHPDVALVQGVIRNDSTGAAERSAGIEIGPVHLVGRALGASRLARLKTVTGIARRRRALRDHVDRLFTSPTEVEALAATAVLARRAALEEVGGFDPGYFLYGEDLDLCRRLRLAGWRIVALPDEWASHESGGTSRTGWERELRWWEGTLRFSAQWWPPMRWWWAAGAAMIIAARLCLRRPTSSPVVVRTLVTGPWRFRRSRRSAFSARSTA